jgi:hypothetical protein
LLDRDAPPLDHAAGRPGPSASPPRAVPVAAPLRRRQPAGAGIQGDAKPKPAAAPVDLSGMPVYIELSNCDFSSLVRLTCEYLGKSRRGVSCDAGNPD